MRRSGKVFLALAAAALGGAEPFPFSPLIGATCQARSDEPTIEFARWRVSGSGVHRLFSTVGAEQWRLTLNNRDAGKASEIRFSADGGQGGPAPVVTVSCTP